MRKVLRFVASKKLDIALWVFGWLISRFLSFKAFVAYLLLSVAVSGLREAHRRLRRRRADVSPDGASARMRRKERPKGEGQE